MSTYLHRIFSIKYAIIFSLPVPSVAAPSASVLVLTPIEKGAVQSKEMKLEIFLFTNSSFLNIEVQVAGS